MYYVDVDLHNNDGEICFMFLKLNESDSKTTGDLLLDHFCSRINVLKTKANFEKSPTPFRNERKSSERIFALFLPIAIN